ncbi:MAG: hypothetical protein JNM55_03645 [Anaerolineales bacterium]|nr:hypothetical protein [Anaerolineales bacterium]
MTENNELFDRKHLRLWRISRQADSISTIVVFIYIFVIFGQLLQYSKIANSQYQTGLISLLLKNPVFILDMIVQMGGGLVQGALYYLVLKGLALGLNIIVETDINYRENKIEGGEEE